MSIALPASVRVAAARLVALGSVCGAILFSAAPVATAADQLPFNDTNINGSITFCDRSNKPVTSGKLTDIPFVWKAVSSVAAPKAWTGPFGKATLIAFQPRENIDPLQWSGKQMTASAHYSNPAFPMAQATNADPALVDFTAIAPLWQGLVEVRMYFSNPDVQVHAAPYPATVIRVAGDSWSAVTPGTASCDVGTAVSSATVLLAPSAIPSASPTFSPVVPGASPKATIVGPTGSARPSSTSPASPQPSTSSTGSATSAGGNQGSDQSGGPAAAGGADPLSASNATTATGPSPVLIAALLLLPLIGVGVGVALGRRRVDADHAD